MLEWFPDELELLGDVMYISRPATATVGEYDSTSSKTVDNILVRNETFLEANVKAFQYFERTFKILIDVEMTMQALKFKLKDDFIKQNSWNYLLRM